MDQPVHARTARATGLAGCRLRCHQGGSAMAADRHATARTSLAATEAIRAARPTTGKPPPSAVAGRLHVKLSRAGREIGRAAAVIATGPATPVERLLADAVPTGRRESPKHVTPAHQAGREAAQV